MNLFKFTLSSFFILFSLNTFSQNTGLTTFPAEIWYCEINEGFTMDDVRDVSMGVKQFSEAVSYTHLTLPTIALV